MQFQENDIKAVCQGFGTFCYKYLLEYGAFSCQLKGQPEGVLVTVHQIIDQIWAMGVYKPEPLQHVCMYMPVQQYSKMP